MTFPKNLVAYEIALERAFRMLLGSQMDSHDLPDQNAVGEAFFKKIEPAEFARQWLAEEKYRFDDSGPDSDEVNDPDPFSSQEEELF